MLGIGIDTGGTCTDAVLYDMDTKEILGSGKTLTTKQNLEIGIANALDQLPAELIPDVKSFSLSTTLATNACVENKGCRAKLLLIGSSPEMIEHLKAIYADYGMDDLSQLVVLDAKPENYFSNAYDPDWEDLRIKAPEYFKDCDAVGIVQMYPKANGGRFELTALRILRDALTVPLTIAYEFSSETDILKTIASTLLNARLIPLIVEFINAVKHVMHARGLDVPLSIVRSDGTLMSEEMARSCPVETLLCGPSASVIGGCELAGEDSAVLLDMGGTTTDIAIIQNNQPVMAPNGILIGQWKTMIKGLDVTAVALGGDTAVRFRDEKLYLDTNRVIPVSVLASQYDYVLPALQEVAKRKRPHTRFIHEFYVLVKDISGKNGYSEYEQKACAILKDGPLITLDFVEKLDVELYYMGLERLERDGIIMKSGLTPTDMMVINGDYDAYDPAAALACARYVAMNVKENPENMVSRVYDLVAKRMYKNLGRVIMQYQYPHQKEFFDPECLDALLEVFYAQAKLNAEHPESETEEGKLAAKLNLTTNLPLIGVGAPAHIFVPLVAKLMGTRSISPRYAHVANALGAIAGRMIARADIIVTAKYDRGFLDGYTVMDEFELLKFKDLDKALEKGKEIALKTIKKRAIFQGLGENAKITLELEENRIGHTKDGLLMEVFIHAMAE